MPTVKKSTKKKPAAKKATTKKATAKKAKATKERKPRKPRDLTPNMIEVLKALKGGSIMTASEISEVSGVLKGRRLPELVEKKYINEMVPEEGKRGKRFKIMAAGKKALDKALKEQ